MLAMATNKKPSTKAPSKQPTKAPSKQARTTPSRAPATAATTAEEAAAEVLALLAQAEKKLEELDLAQLTADERTGSSGKLRDGEGAILSILLDTIDSSPQTFAALADKDHGVDNSVVETAPTRQAIARREALAPVAATLARLSRRLDDDLLAQGEKIREVTSPAYAILKANAPVDAGLRKRASRVFDYYATRGRPKKKPAGT